MALSVFRDGWQKWFVNLPHTRTSNTRSQMSALVTVTSLGRQGGQGNNKSYFPWQAEGLKKKKKSRRARVLVAMKTTVTHRVLILLPPACSLPLGPAFSQGASFCQSYHFCSRLQRQALLSCLLSSRPQSASHSQEGPLVSPTMQREQNQQRLQLERAGLSQAKGQTLTPIQLSPAYPSLTLSVLSAHTVYQPTSLMHFRKTESNCFHFSADCSKNVDASYKNDSSSKK